MSKKIKKTKTLTETGKAEVAESVAAYFDRIGPLGVDLMPVSKWRVKRISSLKDGVGD